MRRRISPADDGRNKPMEDRVMEAWLEQAAARTETRNGLDVLALQLGQTLHYKHEAFQRVVGMHSGYARVLLLLAEKDGQTQANLQRVVGCDGSGITRIVKAMEREHLVKRMADPQDNRYMLVYLTEQGTSIARTLPRRVLEFWRQALQGFSAQEIESLRLLLGRLNGNFAEMTLGEPAKAH
jgi:DNA-binding MarR family transcriptional regulator